MASLHPNAAATAAASQIDRRVWTWHRRQIDLGWVDFRHIKGRATGANGQVRQAFVFEQQMTTRNASAREIHSSDVSTASRSTLVTTVEVWPTQCRWDDIRVIQIWPYEETSCCEDGILAFCDFFVAVAAGDARVVVCGDGHDVD
ncbi:hypothetical protein MHU86_9051 [Fragilaria crotonensis]|nr:hypothetical protein MHU86_9051 [Fragilaria crotonensis]